MKLNMNNYESFKDSFNIYNLITFIDKNYRLFFDKIKKQFVVINIAKNYQICLKFNNFKLNILKTLQFTRIEHSKKIFENIENYNEILTEKNTIFTRQKVSDSLKNLIDYSKRTNHILQSDIRRIIEGKYD